MTKESFSQERDRLLQRAEVLQDQSSEKDRARTAEQLAVYAYSPTLLWPVRNFAQSDKERLLRLMREAAECSDKVLIENGFDPRADLLEKRILQMRSLLHHYQQLLRLRRDEPEAWDDVHELYEDD